MKQTLSSSDKRSSRGGRLQPATVQAVSRLFRRLDYDGLGPIYCDEGGPAFWKDRRGPCEKLGLRLAAALRARLMPGGRSLYVGAGVAELPLLVMETLELGRRVEAFTLRRAEARLLNDACRGLPFRFTVKDGGQAPGRYDHLCLVSVLNDPERYPALSALSYGRAEAASFDPKAFAQERQTVTRLADACLRKMRRPALITTTVEEVRWVTAWCDLRRLPYLLEARGYPTALVGDPVCFLRLPATE